MLAPTGPSAATDDFWREVTFNDAAWHSKITGVGFDRDTPPSNVLDPYIGSGAGTVGTQLVGTVTRAQVEEIAKRKMKDLNARDLAAACRIIEGTARSSGIKVEG